jgi:predicted 3-demethylubiquinone-9 3-methyltransferase (glyoxalase superfamily)
MQKIIPSLWFDANAEQAIAFYSSVFRNSRIVNMSRYGDSGPGPKNTVMAATFQLSGQDFFAINGGPQFKFSPAVSLMVHCNTQDEIDDYWAKLSAGGGYPAMRLAAGQIRPVVADRAGHPGRTDERREEIRRRDEGDPANDQARHRRPQAGPRADLSAE